MSAPTVVDSWELVAAAQTGDREAYAELYRRHYATVFTFLLCRVGERPLAEDLTSETFLRGLRRIDSISYQGRDVEAWFIVIARNLYLDHVKSSRHKLETLTSEFADVDTTSPGPEQQVIDRETATELLHWVAQLSPDQQDCVTLRYFRGLSVAETATALNRSESAAKAVQHRAVLRLAELVPSSVAMAS
ncbi:MAG: sigma-70 family RNA polymerase sigma factor [Pseudonocardiaceae bacterium]